ncbi:uncharacterized protein PSFLO_01793 [Pseudozyma flocculosa]|uniref:Uncharacterized protein n=1 Tax=Pseudozyma flocculosa TaxID=84751 RepID=A0A5C3EW96_9BASI|nr:uncharacterized protein PSFLO_01793 [Pseudozyma flocculosa]
MPADKGSKESQPDSRLAGPRSGLAWPALNLGRPKQASMAALLSCFEGDWGDSRGRDRNVPLAASARPAPCLPASLGPHALQVEAEAGLRAPPAAPSS